MSEHHESDYERGRADEASDRSSNSWIWIVLLMLVTTGFIVYLVTADGDVNDSEPDKIDVELNIERPDNDPPQNATPEPEPEPTPEPEEQAPAEEGIGE